MYFVLLQISALCEALLDKNVLVARTALDAISILFPLHCPFLPPSDMTLLVGAALETLLKRDVSLNRRLTSWLLGTAIDGSSLASCLLKADTGKEDEQETSNHLAYFNAFSKAYVVAALKIVITRAVAAASSLSKPDCVLPYRLLNLILVRSEFSTGIVRSVMDELMCCLKAQVDYLGGLNAGQQLVKDTSGLKLRVGGVKKPSKKAALRSEIVQSVMLFLKSLESHFVWEWMTGLVCELFRHVASSRSGAPGLHTGQPDASTAQSGGPAEGGRGSGDREDEGGSMPSPNGAAAAATPLSASLSLRHSTSAALALLEFVLQALPLVSA